MAVRLTWSPGSLMTGMRIHAELAGRHQRWRSLRSIALGLAPQHVRQARLNRPGVNPITVVARENPDAFNAAVLSFFEAQKLTSPSK